MQPASDSSSAAPHRGGRSVLKAGLAILGAGFLLAAVAAATLAQGATPLEAAASSLHQISLLIMLVGLVVVLVGFRVRATSDWWARYSERRQSTEIANHETAHLGCWEAEMEGDELYMELRRGGQATISDSSGAREMTYEIRHTASVMEIRLEHVQTTDSDYVTRRISPYARETRTLREIVVTETFYTARFLDVDRLEVAPPYGDRHGEENSRNFLVFHRRDGQAPRRASQPAQRPHALDATAD